MACQRVFNTFELVESILMLLPLRDLLRVQAVCKHWNGVIGSSSSIQEVLFLRPAKPETAWLVDITNLPAQMRPLSRYYPTKLRAKAAVSVISKEFLGHQGLIATPVRINPLCLRKRQTPNAVDLDRVVDEGVIVCMHENFEEFRNSNSGSWMNMLVTQPPTQYLTVETWLPKSGDTRNEAMLSEVHPFRSRRREQVLSKKIYEDGGVRFIHLVQAVNKMTGSTLPETIEIYLHGMIFADEDQEDEIRERSEDWRRGLEGHVA